MGLAAALRGEADAAAPAEARRGARPAREGARGRFAQHERRVQPGRALRRLPQASGRRGTALQTIPVRRPGRPSTALRRRQVHLGRLGHGTHTPAASCWRGDDVLPGRTWCATGSTGAGSGEEVSAKLARRELQSSAMRIRAVAVLLALAVPAVGLAALTQSPTRRRASRGRLDPGRPPASGKLPPPQARATAASPPARSRPPRPCPRRWAPRTASSSTRASSRPRPSTGDARIQVQ